MTPISAIVALSLLELVLGGTVAFLLGALAHRRDQVDRLRYQLARTRRDLNKAHAELELGQAVDRAVAGTCEDLP